MEHKHCLCVILIWLCCAYHVSSHPTDDSGQPLDDLKRLADDSNNITAMLFRQLWNTGYIMTDLKRMIMLQEETQREIVDGIAETRYSALKSQVDAILQQQEKSEKMKECKADLKALEEKVAELQEVRYPVPYKCGPQNTVSILADGRLMVDATGRKWPQDIMCSVYFPTAMEDDDASYSLSVDLYNVNTNVGHVGVMYNYEDDGNYDFVYFRTHSASGCYQTGAVVNGAANWDNAESAPCPNPVTTKTLFNVKVVVRQDEETSQIYLNDELVTDSQAMSLRKTGKGGVIVANGYDNSAIFQNFKIE